MIGCVAESAMELRVRLNDTVGIDVAVTWVLCAHLFIMLFMNGKVQIISGLRGVCYIIRVSSCECPGLVLSR